MNRKIWTAILIGAFGVLLWSGAAAVDYKEYKFAKLMDDYFEISFDELQVSVSIIRDDVETINTYGKDEFSKKNGEIYANDELVFGSSGVFIGGEELPYDDIWETRITEDDDIVTIRFFRRKPSDTRVSRFKKGNLLSSDRSVTIDEDEFIRGLIFTITGNIEIYGEVNKDVISVLGDIYVAPDAVVRGDIASVRGRVDAARDASIYGELYDAETRGARRKHRFSRYERDWEYLGDVMYNRVDGLALYSGLKYHDIDSLLPTVWGQIGYGFNSERWRYEVGVEQVLLREPLALSVGGALYRRLATGDGWILGNDENTTFALIAREDFRDYYEGEGGTIYVKAKAWRDFSFDSRFRIEDTKWLDARRHLWSLLGGSKLFSENFSTVPDGFRTSSIAEIDTTSNAYWYNRIEWDTRLEGEPFEMTAWHVTADLEWASESFGSDFDYRRYTLAARRYQKVNRRTMLIVRGMYGGSDGYLPMYKRYYLGGLGTLRGYDHKEYMGSRFWLFNAEYRLDFPKVEAAFSVFWDVGQIANDRRLDGQVDIKNDVGIALYLEDDFKVSLAKRLDRSFDNNPIFYVRLDHVF